MQCLDRPRHGPPHEHCATVLNAKVQGKREGPLPASNAMFDWPSFLRSLPLPSSLSLPCSLQGSLAMNESPTNMLHAPGQHSLTFVESSRWEASLRGTRTFTLILGLINDSRDIWRYGAWRLHCHAQILILDERDERDIFTSL